MTTMQCLECGQTRETRQRIQFPERQLRCSACKQVTRHRVMDPKRGDWREHQNRETVSGRRTAVPARQPVLPPRLQQVFDDLHLVPVFICGCNHEAWLASPSNHPTSYGRRLVFFDADASPEELDDLAAQVVDAIAEEKQAQ